MKHPCTVSKLQKHQSFYMHFVNTIHKEVCKSLVQLKLSWSNWYEHSVNWVKSSHSNQGLGFLISLIYSLKFKTSLGGLLMHVCLAHDQKSMSMTLTSDHILLRWDQLVLHPPEIDWIRRKRLFYSWIRWENCDLQSINCKLPLWGPKARGHQTKNRGGT